jgi:hypothetical protein
MILYRVKDEEPAADTRKPIALTGILRMNYKRCWSIKSYA